MAIDYSGCAHPKSRPKALEKEEKRHAIALRDARENTKARVRAKGQCEVRMELGRYMFRCPHKDSQTHHLIGGNGRRNRGKSILAEYKLRVCQSCHDDITANILRPTTAEHDAKTVRYWRHR